MTKSKMAIKKQYSSWINFPKRELNASKIFVRLLLLLMIGSTVFFVVTMGKQFWSNIWPVQRVLLEGDTHYLKASDIQDFMQQQKVKGLLSIDLDDLQQAAKSIDWIQSVEIRKVWPEQLVFKVVEHKPVARVDDFILTQKGTKIKQVGNEVLFSQLPEINFYHSETVELEHYQRVWREFKQVKRQFELLSLELQGLYIDPVKNWRMKFMNGLELNLGRKQRTERVDRLVRVFSSIQNKSKIKSIDLRYHNGLAVEWQNENESQTSGDPVVNG